MGTPVVVDSHLSHVVLILLVAYFWRLSRRKRDLERSLADTCATMGEEVKLKSEHAVALTKEMEASEEKVTTLTRTNDELRVRAAEAEAALRQGILEFEGVCAKEREASGVVSSLSRALAEQVLVISELKAKLNRVEAERSEWAHQIHLLIQDKEDLEARSQKRQQKVLELEDKLSECYARLSRRCTYDGSKTPFSLWGSPVAVNYSERVSNNAHLQSQNPSYSAPTQSPLK